MPRQILIREAQYPRDFAPVAAVITAERAGWPVSAEELASEHAARDPQFYKLDLLAELDGESVGVGSVGHIPFSHQPGRFGLDIRVRPEYQGQGVGKALYQALIERIAPFNPRELITYVWEALPRARRFVEERGFQPVWRRVDSTLDVRGFDFSPYQGLEERLRADGIQVTTFAGLAHDPLRESKLHALDWALLQDIPFGEPQTMLPLQQFIDETIHAPAFLPEACFIARQADTWIGYSNLMQGPDFFNIQMTGVLAGWRGRGVATLLKLRGVQYALAHGGLELRTVNDEVNQAMVAINRRMGFRETGATLRYKKLL